jgi:hypothetical protein
VGCLAAHSIVIYDAGDRAAQLPAPLTRWLVQLTRLLVQRGLNEPNPTQAGVAFTSGEPGARGGPGACRPVPSAERLVFRCDLGPGRGAIQVGRGMADTTQGEV